MEDRKAGWLVLKCKIGSSIFIGKDQEIEVYVSDITGKGSVSLAFKTKEYIPIKRGEIILQNH